MNGIDYLHLQLRLEGKSPVGNDRLKQVEVVPEEDMLLMLIAQLANNQIVAYYHEALTSELHNELAKRVQGIIFPKIEPLLDVWKTENVPFAVGHYKTYIFPSRFKGLSNDNVKRLHN